MDILAVIGLGIICLTGFLAIGWAIDKVLSIYEF